MSLPVSIHLENISKRYWLYTRYRERLGQILLTPITHRDYARSFWALQDINLDVHQGETLGVIGVNGSGKSTLLQIIAGTLQPTLGKLQVHGRLTALLELGAGFTTEFTGRENIFLNGATLGISEKEMKQRLDQIIEFAEIGEFIDQPVKLYSSGMYVRLGFAIATCVDPEILVVDEALAVGDASFVIKCMDRMRQLKQNGTAILFVTHDIQSVRSLCDRALWINQGKPVAIGPTLDISSQYIQFLFNRSVAIEKKASSDAMEFETVDEILLDGFMSLRSTPDLIRWGTHEMVIEGYVLRRPEDSSTRVFDHGDRMIVEFQARVESDIDSQDIGFGMAFRNERGLEIINETTYDAGARFPPMKKGQRIRMTFELENILAPGIYSLVLNIEDRARPEIKYYDFIENVTVFRAISDRSISSMVLPRVAQSHIFLP